MKRLVLLRGAMGAGKSTFLRTNNLSQYVLCADDIRLLLQSPVLGLDGKYQISQKQDKQVWSFLMQALEARMSRGEFTIIDATHQTGDLINKYKDLCTKHRYRCTVVDFTDVPIETALKQNLQRPEYKQVPEAAIRNAYERFKSQPVPGWVDVIKPEQYQEYFQYTPSDFSSYEKVHVIGDLQGCFTVLDEYLGGGLNPNHKYIFVGDLIDRGIENHLVIEFMLKIYDQPNVIIVRGNHEEHLENWANDLEIKSREFINKTQPQLEAHGIKKKDVRQLCRKLAQICFFKYQDKYVIVTHGGLSTLPDNLIYLATAEMVKGVGKYEDDIDNIFTHNTENWCYSDSNGGHLYLAEGRDCNIWQIHGHRNLAELPIQAGPRSFNLEGKVEFGGHLRVVTLDQFGWAVYQVQNKVFDQGKDVSPQTGSGALLDRLRASSLIQEKVQAGTDISSFNFKREVFFGKAWDELNVQARGLFINTKTSEIVIRSYNKSFNIGERPDTELSNLARTLVFPVKVYHKYNGFLGLIGYDSSVGLTPASKSTISGPYAEWFKTQIKSHFISKPSDTLETFNNLLRDQGLTATFEVIDPINDPHIIEYAKPNIILLDLVHRTEQYSKMDYSDVRQWGNRLGLDTKVKETTLDNWQDFVAWYNHVTTDNTVELEGYMVEDSTGYMVKVKLPFYNFWKKMRGVKDTLVKPGNPKVRAGILTTPLDNQVYAFMKGLDKQELSTLSIIDVRNRFNA